MLAELGLSEAEATSERFASFFSGDMDSVDGFLSWATPYALSIMGSPQYQNCPFGNGNGYGDGRAVSIGEVVVDGQRWEMQLKGGGTTPFCRGGDGRAVLRSSVREFLASEAMHCLGIETTRALSLVVSGEETSRRPWYSRNTEAPSEDDPRLAHLPLQMRRMLLGQIGKDPDVMIQEPCAITTRVAPSFLRIGHIDLFARRASAPTATPEQLKQLQQIVEHALFREYPEVPTDIPLEDRVVAMLDIAAERIGQMVAGWLRVGFCQGNFNCDNCLVGGRTMDYGPFGWMDQYNPGFAKWVGSGDHFAFINQPGAGLANYQTLVESCRLLLGDQADVHIAQARASGKAKIFGAAEDTWRVKMGFSDGEGGVAAKGLWEDLEPLLRGGNIDYTMFWRQLSHIADLDIKATNEERLALLKDAWYKEPTASQRKQFGEWIDDWVAHLEADSQRSNAGARMRAVNPKYIAREWILVECYEAAAKGDYSVLETLYNLFLTPYDEHPQLEGKYYGRAPDAATRAGGVAFMT